MGQLVRVDVCGFVSLVLRGNAQLGCCWLAPCTGQGGRCGNFCAKMYNLYIMQANQTLVRTQLYLTEAQQKRLALASRSAAVTKSELIRRAVDQFLDQQPAANPAGKAQRLGSIAGLWAGREDMADPSAYVQQLRAPRF